MPTLNELRRMLRAGEAPPEPSSKNTYRYWRYKDAGGALWSIGAWMEINPAFEPYLTLVHIRDGQLLSETESDAKDCEDLKLILWDWDSLLYKEKREIATGTLNELVAAREGIWAHAPEMFPKAAIQQMIGMYSKMSAIYRKANPRKGSREANADA